MKNLQTSGLKTVKYADMNFDKVRDIRDQVETVYRVHEITQKYYFLKKNRNNLAMKKKLCYNFINKKSKAMKETPIFRG